MEFLIFKSKPFRLTVLVIFLLELLSFFSWLLPSFGNIAFLIILLLILIISLEDLRYGVSIALAELIIGSHGYLFSFGPEDLSVSFRLGIFLVLMTVAMLKILRERDIEFYRSKLFWPYVLLALAVLFAVVRGALLGNGASTVFFDMNGYVFFGLAFPFWQAIKSRKDLMLLIQVSTAALVMSLVKVYFLLYAFSHRLWWMLRETYVWVRDTRIGEITQITDQFFRIFFQSQIYSIIGLLIVVLFVSSFFAKNSIKNVIKKKTWWGYALFGSLLIGSILVSFSRSNWVGIFASAVLLPLVIWTSEKKQIKSIISAYVNWFAMGIVSLILVTAVVLFPFPTPSGDFSAGSLLSRRAFTFTGEAGVSSRWQLLPPLWSAVKDNLILGSGFGKAVTYKTEDPRILAQNPTGEYTTFTFEWGYLDLWLKLGLIGMVVYGLFILMIVRENIQLLFAFKKSGTANWELVMGQGLLLGGIAVIATHTFSPYLNHPLGIGYLLIWALFVHVLGKKKTIDSAAK